MLTEMESIERLAKNDFWCTTLKDSGKDFCSDCYYHTETTCKLVGQNPDHVHEDYMRWWKKRYKILKLKEILS